MLALCTAEKCRELSEKIEKLESRLLTLESEFIFHTNTPVSDAHDIDLNITGSLQYDSSTEGVGMDIYLVDSSDELLNTGRIVNFPLPFVTEWDFNAHKNETIPTAHNYIPNVLLDVFPQDDGTFVIKSTIDGFSDEDSIDVNKLLESLVLEFNINEDIVGENTEYHFEISLGNQVVSDVIVLASSDDNKINDLIDKYFNDLNFYFRIDDLDRNDWNFHLKIGDKVREAILDLPAFGSGGGGSGNEEPTKTLSIDGNYDKQANNLNISVTVNGKSAAVAISLDDLMETLDKIWAVLGGNNWTYNSTNKTASLNLQPETSIKTTGLAQYTSNVGLAE